MKKSSFNNKGFYWALITLITGMLIWNFYLTITQSKLLGLLPISIQSTLLGLIFTKHKYAKIIIKVWAILFLSIASGLQFLGRLIQDFAEGFENVVIQHYLITGITIMLGVLIVIYTNKTVEINGMEVEKSTA